jgi:hypothetical protein
MTKTKQTTKKAVKFDKVEEKKSGSIQVEVGNTELVKIQFLQAMNNQLNMIIKLLEEIKNK